MTDKKYTDEQIKEALQIRMPHDAVCREAYDLINRQQAEIEKRDADIEGLLFSIQSLSGHLSSAKAEAIKEFENLIVNNLIEQAYSRDYLLCLIKEWAKEMTESRNAD